MRQLAGSGAVGVAYYRRFRMEIDLGNVDLPEPVLPDGFHFRPWDSEDLEPISYTHLTLPTIYSV